jgi:hypothetical protein
MALSVPLLLILAGALPVLFLAGLVVWQAITLFTGGGWVPLPVLLLFSDHSVLQAGKAAPVLAFIPDLSFLWSAGPDSLPPLTWVLSRVHFALLPALAGVALVAIGVRRVLERLAVVSAERKRLGDRLRRVRDYQRDDGADTIDGRREPFIANHRATRAPRHAGVQG